MKVVKDLLVKKTRYRVANLGGLSNIVISDHIVVTLILQCLLVSRYLINIRVSQRHISLSVLAQLGFGLAWLGCEKNNFKELPNRLWEMF